MNIQIIDPGHKYKLPSLDGKHEQVLQFVKRCDPGNPTRFPGNTNAYPGTTIQCVLRALLERFRYLQKQVWAPENIACIFCLRVALWLIEFRAARRHKSLYLVPLSHAEKALMCDECLHTRCHHGKATRKSLKGEGE
jgi:hypothetical protein